MIDLEKIKLKNENEKIIKKIATFNMLVNHLQVSIDDVLNRYNHLTFRDTKISKKELFHQIINNKLTKENIDFLNKSGNVTAHQNDKRTYKEYATELVLSWLIEDTVVMKLINKGVPAELQGADSEREFLTQNEIDTTPDIRIGIGNEYRLVEVFIDWTGYWSRKGSADLRGNKFLRLVNERALLLGLSPMDGMGFLIDVAEMSHGFVPSTIYNYGGKSGYTTKEISKYLKLIDILLVDLCDIVKEKQNAE